MNSELAQSISQQEPGMSLCEALDRVLAKGAVAAGEVVISVAGIDLIYLSLQALLTSMGPAHPTPRKEEPLEHATQG